MAAPQRVNSLEGTIHRGNLSGWNSVFLSRFQRRGKPVATIQTKQPDGGSNRGMFAWRDSSLKLRLPEDSLMHELQLRRVNSAV